jgi:DNA-binding NarL/FixJ family response regulator
MLREALSLDGGIQIIGEAGGGKEAVLQTHVLAPDVVLMDVRMPAGDGVAAAREITDHHPGTRVVALTWMDDPGTVRDMITAGATGYVVKGGTIDELCAAIRRASTGEAELDQRVLPRAMEDFRRLLEEERGRREQIERLANARAEFVQVLSHQLRTPLTVISGALRMLEQANIGEIEQSLLESAVRRAGELEFLAEGLELIASGTANEGIAYPPEAVQSAMGRVGIEPQGVALADEAWEGVPHRYVHRVACELLSNAARHGVAPVEVSTRREGFEGILIVRDSGGWSAGDQDFTAFFQEDMSATRAHSGFGLGLFVASRLCQACDGSLSVTAHDGRTVAEARFRLR